MKVICDVCGREEASLFCCADEAALCAACDRRVHRANKLAGKHRRLPFLPSSSAHSPPLCDVCKEKEALVFCQEDRAILCSDCDAPIHAANQLTMRHTRFLLGGVRLSSEEAEVHTNQTTHSSAGVTKRERADVVTEDVACTAVSDAASNSSSISEYLIKTLPGWRVEDLLVDDAAATAAAACSDNVEDVFFLNDELLPFITAEEFSVWSAPLVPQAPPPLPPPPCYPTTPTASGCGGYANYHHAEHAVGMKSGRERWSEDGLTVPQISSPSRNTNKRSRPSAWYL